MPIALVLIAALLSLILIPLQKHAEKKKFEKDLDAILKGKKMREPFSIDPDVMVRVLFIMFAVLVVVILLGLIEP